MLKFLFIFPKTFFSNPEMVKRDTKVRLPPHGLVNKGNDCFFNSVMQCVLSITDLTTFYSEKSFIEDQKISNAFKTFINEYAKKDTLSPEPFMVHLRSKIKILNGKQQDSHEFLISFINLLYKELPSVNKEVISDKNEYFMIKEKNVIADLFFGLQQTTVVCNACLNKCTSPSHFTILSLTVFNDLTDSIAQYSKETLLHGKNEYNCDNCKLSKITKHSIEIIYYPRILIIQLMRFDGSFRKNDDLVNIPSEIQLNGNTYDVIGITCHSGVLNSGHYVSYCKRNSVWYGFNDLSVTRIQSPPLKKSDAYLVFYEKR